MLLPHSGRGSVRSDPAELMKASRASMRMTSASGSSALAMADPP